MDRLYLFMNKKVIEENKQLAEENYKLKRLIRSYRQVISPSTQLIARDCPFNATDSKAFLYTFGTIFDLFTIPMLLI